MWHPQFLAAGREEDLFRELSLYDPNRMSHSATTDERSLPDSFQTDSLSKGLGVLAAVNILQRGIGFARNLAFCGLMSQADVGLWALASSFLVLAAPLSVLGLPGSFGRFVEVFRQSGQLAAFLRRACLIAAGGTAVLAAALIVLPGLAGLTIFGDASISLASIALLAATLVIVVGFNTLLELLNGLRQPSAVSSMQLVSSLAFSVLGVAAVLWRPQWQVLLAAYAVSMLLGLAPGVLRLQRRCASAFAPRRPLASGVLANRIAPFAATVWVGDLLTNLFNVVAPYVLLHFATADTELNHALVGQFHTARILPLLFLSLAMMVAGIILPYWSSDWESGHRGRVVASMSAAIKLSVAVFWAASLAALIVSPLLFGVILQGRYAIAEQALPLAMLQCVYAAALMLNSSFLRCIEANRWSAAMPAVGLGINVAAHAVAVPLWGVAGALAAMLASTALMLAANLWRSYRGYSLDRGVLLMLVAPATILLSPVCGMFALAACVVIAGRTDWLLDRKQRGAIDAIVVPRLRRLGLRSPSIWPAAA